LGFTVETFGNATVQVCRDGKPLLTTDPWLVGSAYFGSWALDKPLTPEQHQKALDSAYIWLSHGHPDHMHHESLALMPRGKKVLLPDHYSSEIADHLRDDGFDVTVLKYRQWTKLADGLEVLCIENWNQDGILVIRAGDALLLNTNDSPLFGEGPFLRKLVREHPNQKTYIFALCAIDADMLNIVDSSDNRVIEPPEHRKKGQIWTVARMCDYLGVSHYCCSSNQHIYIRQDSIWANDYRVGWDDIVAHWTRPHIKLVEPFCTIDLSTGAIARNHPSQESNWSAVTQGTGDDDWSARLNEQEWADVKAFFCKFETLQDKIDFVAVAVGGETRRFMLRGGASAYSEDKLRGFRFSVPKQSLLECIKWGYFDDLLIGNFMKTQLINTTLYPNFTPQIAKLGGNAKVYTKEARRTFWAHYWRRSPGVLARDYCDRVVAANLVNIFRRIASSLGLTGPLKRIYRTWRGDLRSART
jgi:hypothetical protein